MMNVGPGSQGMMSGASGKPPVGGLNLITVTRKPGGIMNVEVNRSGGQATIHSPQRTPIMQSHRVHSVSSTYSPGLYQTQGVYTSGSPAMPSSISSNISVPVAHIDTSMIQAPRPGPQLVPKAGSNYSGSPRSSIGSLDSKSSSPRNSLVHPPPPYGDHKANAVTVVRSTVNVEPKPGSPRSSITSISSASVYEQRVPSPRTANQNERYVATRNVAVEHHITGGAYDRYQMSPGAHAATGSPKHAVASLFERFNEPAPPQHYETQPPPYDARMRAIHLSQVHMPPQQQQLQPQPPQQHTYRVTRLPTQPNTSASTSEPAAVSATVSMPPQTVTHLVSPSEPSALLTRLRGLHYDTVPPKQDGPSDAERKLAALTQQLENEMNLSSPGKKTPSRSPPPYHGPHLTPASKASPASSTLSSPGSSSKGSVMPSLPVQVTPPQPKGPSEAERKLEALTQELENQMENNPQGDYYGKPSPTVPPHAQLPALGLCFLCNEAQSV